MRNRLITVFVALITLTLCSVAYTESTTGKLEEENKKTKQVQQKPIKKSKKNETLREFTPSEEISIDKPVAFPVDI